MPTTIKSRSINFSITITTIEAIFLGIDEFVSLGAGLNSFYGSRVAFALMDAILICGIYVLVRFMGTKKDFMLNDLSLNICSMATTIFIKAIGEVKLPELWGTVDKQARNEKLGVFVGLFGAGAFTFTGSIYLKRGIKIMESGRASVL